MSENSSVERIPGYCSLCIARCGSIAVLDRGRFVALEPDPDHPTGEALCAKGRAAPEIVYHPDRLLYPLKRTRPKGDPDPGWQRISWDEALDTTAGMLKRIASESGPESVVFSAASPSTSAVGDSTVWIERLMHLFGTPNLCASMELCGWGRYLATTYTFGMPVPGVAVPDIENAGCILFWGYNPTVARITHATATVKALKRGARLIVVDPRRVGFASRADLWLRVTPGTDAALALAITNVMIARGWYDRTFVQSWTNGPLLVRTDTGALLRETDLASGGTEGRFVAWDHGLGGIIGYDPATGTYDSDPASLALEGTYAVETVGGTVACRPAFAVVAEECGRFGPETAEAVCGVPSDQIEAAARMLWESRPLAYYAWSGVEQHTSSTQAARAIAQLYALTGSFDAVGGNVLLPSVASTNVAGQEFVDRANGAPALGLRDRPLGPSRFGFVTTDELYRAIMQKEPYPVRGLVGFGANLLIAHSEPLRGREALRNLEFFVHADLFMNPTAELADIVLPVASSFECEALKIGFDISVDAQSRVQLRRGVVSPPGEARSDAEIVFDLAVRLGYGDRFWGGDIVAAWRHQLEPSGLTVEQLRAAPGGIHVPLEPHYRKYGLMKDGAAMGFPTRSKKVELYSETFLAGGYPPVPSFDLAASSSDAARFPLILTSSKSTVFCESQHRNVPALRRKSPEPAVEMHPDAAASRGIVAGEWVRIETPSGSVRAKAKLNDMLDPRVVCGEHGWWQACAELGLPGFDPFGPDGANLNLVISNDAIDPVSGSVPHRSTLCQISKEHVATAAAGGRTEAAAGDGV